MNSLKGKMHIIKIIIYMVNKRTIIKKLKKIVYSAKPKKQITNIIIKKIAFTSVNYIVPIPSFIFDLFYFILFNS